MNPRAIPRTVSGVATDDARLLALTSLDALLQRGSAWADDLDAALWGPAAVTEPRARDLLARLGAAASFLRGDLDAHPAQRFGRLYDALRWAPPELAALAERWRAAFEQTGRPWVRARRPAAAQPADWPHRTLPGRAAWLAAKAPVALLAVGERHRAWTLGAGQCGPEADGAPLALSDDGTFAVALHRGSLVGHDLAAGPQWRAPPRGSPWLRAAVLGDRVYACARGEVAVVDRGSGAVRSAAAGIADPQGVLPAAGAVLVWGREGLARLDADTGAVVAAWRAPHAHVTDVCADAMGGVYVSLLGAAPWCLRASDLTARWTSRLELGGPVACTPSGERVLVARFGFGDVVAAVLRGGDGAPVSELRARGAGGAVAIAPSGERAFARGALWDAASGARLGPLPGPGGVATSAAWSADGRWLLGQCLGAQAAWALADCHPRAPRREGSARASCVTAGGELLCNGDGRCERWSLDGELLGELVGEAGEAFAQHGTVVTRAPASAPHGEGEALSLWSVTTDRRADLGVGRALPLGCADAVVVRRSDGRHEVLSAATGAARWSERAPSVEAVGGGRWLVCYGEGGAVVRACADGAEVLALGAGARLVAAGADGDAVACLRADAVECWDVAARALRWSRPAGLPRAPDALALLDAGATVEARSAWFVPVGEDELVTTRRWDARSGADLGLTERTLAGHTNPVESARGGVRAVAARGVTVVTDEASGQPVATLPQEVRALDGGGGLVLLASPEGPEVYELRRPEAQDALPPRAASGVASRA